jgi:cell wall assembly regulator SMI1
VTNLTEALKQFDHVLNQFEPNEANRLQPHLTLADIDRAISKFSWSLLQDGYALYQWHNGLSGQPRSLNLMKKLLR